jgi:hypothetical protein
MRYKAIVLSEKLKDECVPTFSQRVGMAETFRLNASPGKYREFKTLNRRDNRGSIKFVS